jgi:radical SAM superfamily enzyme YgiQ (UPF0313 family)
MGIGALAGYLLQQKKTVKILDEHITPVTDGVLDDYVADLSHPYIFGISCLSAGIGRGYELSKMIKTKYPNSKVILGGIHPTVLPEEALETGYVDIVVRREGEEILNLLYDAIKRGDDYSQIQGISFRDGNGHIIHNPPAKLPSINSLPSFPYHLFTKYPGKYDLGFIMSSRGCPYNCIFCSQRSVSGQSYRYTTPEKVIEELDFLINEYQQTHISFFDDNFVVNRERTKRLCKLIHDNGFNKKATFDCQTRGDAIDNDILSYLKRANFTAIDIGLETASERLMTLLNKGETVKQNIEAVKLLQAFGFRVSGTFILGLPTETKEERWQALRLAKELQLDHVRFNNATPYPGTRLYELAKEENRLNIAKDWGNLNACGTLVAGPFNTTKLAYVPRTTTEKELTKDILRINLFFSLSPKRVFRILFGGGTPHGWLLFPKKWYFSPKECYYLAQFGFNVLASLFKSLLP